MATIAVLTAFVIVVAITAAAALALVSAGIRREERDFTLTRQAPDRVSRGTRLLTGLYPRRNARSGLRARDDPGVGRAT